MKFGEINRQEWPALAPYVDTCLLPLTGLSGRETPPEAGAALEQLRDLMDLVEIPFKGRIVTYPAVQYGGPSAEGFRELVEGICANLRLAGFRHIVLITARRDLAETPYRGADAMIAPSEGEESDALKARVFTLISELWMPDR